MGGKKDLRKKRGGGGWALRISARVFGHASRGKADDDDDSHGNAGTKDENGKKKKKS